MGRQCGRKGRVCLKGIDIGILALKNVLRARWKTILCALAIAVGVASTYLICEISANARQRILGEVEKSGLGGVMIFSEGKQKAKLDVDQVRQLPQNLPQVKAAMPVFVEYGSYQLKGQKGSAAIWGIDQFFEVIFPVELKYGRLPNAQDLGQGSRVAVVEDTLAKQLYQRENIVGKEITIYRDSMGECYQIIGVVQSQKGGIEQMVGAGKLPVFLYTPYTTSKQYSPNQSVEQLAVACRQEQQAEAVTAAVIQHLSRQSQGGKFSAENISGYLDSFSAILSTVSWLIAAIGGISLVVGGIGVMNSMVSAVESRKKEIGIYLAIGAKPRDIVRCYLLESVFLCLLGGASGTAAAMGLLWAGGKLLGLALVVHWKYLFFSLIASVGCGLLFGALPARRAASLSPMEAIRFE